MGFGEKPSKKKAIWKKGSIKCVSNSKCLPTMIALLAKASMAIWLDKDIRHEV